MKTSIIAVILCALICIGCSGAGALNSVVPEPDGQPQAITQHTEHAADAARWITWGVCQLVIARDGSGYSVTPERSADAYWGYHLNAVKLLEVSPGQNCIKISKIELLANSDLAVDISITHPYNNPVYTGFDVRGIIMFPSSQWLKDPELVEYLGWNYGNWHWRWASCRKGDAELMNPDGYTTIWAPYYGNYYYPENYYELEEGFPIFGYYQGKMASGDDIGTVNGFKYYYSNETRHMFEAGKTVTRTFIIRPPEQGPIEATYSVYAHWVEPLEIPVTDPAKDFGPEANSPLPYEFRIEQIGPIDMDAPPEVRAQNLLWHIKYWHFGIESWNPGGSDLLASGTCGPSFTESFDKCPDCYMIQSFTTSYCLFPDYLPGTMAVLFSLAIDNDGSPFAPHLATDYYIAWLDFEACDGEW